MNHPDIRVNGRFWHAPLTGVQRYAREIVACLAGRVQVIRPGGRLGRVTGHVWEQFVLPGKIPPNAVLWSPANSGPLRAPRHVVSLHDLAALEHPEWFHPAFAAWYAYLIPRLARRAHTILTVSEFSKERLVTMLNLSPHKVRVISPGVGAQFRPAAPPAVAAVQHKYGLAASYFLWVGVVEPRKNLPALLTAWRLLQPQLPQVELVLVGTAGRIFREVTLEPLPPGVRRLGAVPEADLPALYSGARALILPSLYEGFGLPALEALACGTAVLASPAAAIETAAVMRLDPHDPVQMATAMQDILVDDGQRAARVRQGLADAASCTWAGAAEAVYQTLCQAAREAGPAA